MTSTPGEEHEGVCVCVSVEGVCMSRWLHIENRFKQRGGHKFVCVCECSRACVLACVC